MQEYEEDPTLSTFGVMGEEEEDPSFSGFGEMDEEEEPSFSGFDVPDSLKNMFDFSGFGKGKGGGLSVMDWVMRIGGVILLAVIVYLIITNWSKITNFACGSSSGPSAFGKKRGYKVKLGRRRR
jgi:hypothetical protein